MDFKDFKEFLGFSKRDKIRIALFVLSTVGSGFIIVFSISPNSLKGLNDLALLILFIVVIFPVWFINQVLWWLIWIRVFKEFAKRIVTLMGLPSEAKESFSSFLDQELVPNLVLKYFPLSLVADFFTIMSSYFGAGIIYLTSKSIILLYGIIILFNLSVYIILDRFVVYICQNIKKDQLKSLFRPIIDDLKKDKKFIKHLDERLKRIENIIKERNKTLSNT